MNLIGESDWILPVGFDSPIEEIERLLGVTNRANTRMLNEGRDCDLRWRSDVSCLACPLSEAENPESAKCDICRTSTQEERLTTLLAAKSGGL